MSKEIVTKTSAKVEAPVGEVFDFTNGVEVMDARTRSAYYAIRRVALQRGDASLLPEGKLISLVEVETVIGRELGETERPRPCCV